MVCHLRPLSPKAYFFGEMLYFTGIHNKINFDFNYASAKILSAICALVNFEFFRGEETLGNNLSTFSLKGQVVFMIMNLALILTVKGKVIRVRSPMRIN